MNIAPAIKALHKDMTEWRHLLHQNPGTKYEEHFAARLVADKLTEWGIPFESGIAETGIVATIRGKGNGSGKTIGLRADMDALDIAEQSGQPWASKIPGKMHGCGHDGHTAALLGAAKYFNDTRDFDGTIHLIFQPAEEGGRGADRMIEEGLFERFPCDEVYAIHNWPGAKLGQALVSAGPVMASVDRYSIKVQGVSGHPGFPDSVINPVFVAARITTAIEELMNKHRAQGAQVSFHPGVSKSSSDGSNVVGENVTISGTVRTFDEKVREEVENAFREICDLIPASYVIGEGKNTQTASADIDYKRGTDVTNNAELQAQFAAAALQKVFGKDNVLPFHPVLGGEDFSTMARHVPGAYIAVGQKTSDPKSPHSQGLHNPGYDFNDEILPIAVQYYAALVEGRLPLDPAKELTPAVLPEASVG
ncbi:MAG: amidohydrolase [Alphaproteobacteria bacterium]|nr:amidohydrolase [Alphaproteobacteria bacterium]MCD8526336.1 amidohydrolase [Alphaproteobacteria bacterium]MCD8570142.1 amidohydrolase [Alphaproteobacteria bacterium]